MRMDRRAFVGGAIALSAAPLAAEAHQAGKVHRVGVILTTNLKTAKALGLTISPTMLLRADQLIE